MSGTTPTPFLVLFSRQQYHTCHIKVSDIDRPIAALTVGKDFYSFFRAIVSGREVFKFIMRLSYRGDRFVVTIMPKGYAVWLHEPHVQAIKQHKRASALESASAQMPPLACPQPTHFLVSLNQCQLEDLRVQGINEPLPGLVYGDRTFSLLEMETNPDVVMEMVGRLVSNNYETIILIIKTEEEPNFAICVHEKVAELANSAILSTRFLTTWGFRF
jgi:hypothetical protein